MWLYTVKVIVFHQLNASCYWHNLVLFDYITIVIIILIIIITLSFNLL